MKVRIHLDGMDYPGIARTSHEIGRIYEEKGELDGAMRLSTKSLGMQLRMHGEGLYHTGIAGTTFLQPQRHGTIPNPHPLPSLSPSLSPPLLRHLFPSPSLLLVNLSTGRTVY